MKFLKSALLAACLVALMSSAAYGQAALPSTTLTGATTAKSWFPLSLASTAGIPNYWNGQTILVIDGEAACVNLVVGSYVQVNRGCQGSASQNHAAGATVYYGPPQDFYFLPPGAPGGACTASQYPFMPYIVINSGGSVIKWNCTGGIWVTS